MRDLAISRSSRAARAREHSLPLPKNETPGPVAPGLWAVWGTRSVLQGLWAAAHEGECIARLADIRRPQSVTVHRRLELSSAARTDTIESGRASTAKES